MTKVLVLKGDSYHAVAAMFISNGYEATFDENDGYDVVCFTGGSDVSPHLYGEENTGKSYTDPVRDVYETEMFEDCRADFIPMIGICRGGQFLNVMNGGTMIQHVGSISGYVYDMENRLLHVDHHQGIQAPKEGDGYTFESCLAHGELILDYAGYFPETKSLIFQPHPEWGHKPTEDYFFELFEKHIGG